MDPRTSNIEFGAILNRAPLATVCALDWVAGSRASKYHGHERGRRGFCDQTHPLCGVDTLGWHPI